MSAELSCSFCTKRRSQVEHMVAGTETAGAGQHKVLICDECIDLAAKILAELRAQSEAARP